MLRCAVFIGLLALFLAGTSFAGDAEVRDAARQYNCLPKKIIVLRQSIGQDSTVTYKVECNLPKATEQRAGSPTSLTVACRLNLCQVAQ
ncbi:MAG: hypothetical protein WBK91_11010 [Alphaproteobacteria bacterium]